MTVGGLITTTLFKTVRSKKGSVNIFGIQNLKGNKIKSYQMEPQGYESCYNRRSAILRYSPNEERFQLKLIHNKRIFNFDRKTSDNVESILERITNSIKKKEKTFDGKVALICDGEKVEDSANARDLLENAANGNKNLAINVGTEAYEIVVNPPEIHGVKFLRKSIVGFPIFPYKMETSDNFSRDDSKYAWEFCRDKQTPLEEVTKNKKMMRRVVDVKEGNWFDAGSSNFVFVPGEELIGAKIRFTCYPSNGKCFGLKFQEELPEVVSPLPVNNPIYLERFKRIGKVEDIDSNNWLRVVSYNCLAECYATEEWFTASPKDALRADFRLPYLCKEFSCYNADIYCLQEIEDKYFDRIFSPFFETTRGFKGFLSSKTGNVKEGVALFFNPKKLQPIKFETVVISEHIKTMSIWKNVVQKNGAVSERLEDRNSVLQVSIFQPVACPNTVLIVSNTHLYFHPDADHIRLLQTIASVDYVESVSREIKKRFTECRIIVMFCGDFNCTPPFSSFRFLTSGKVECNDFDWTSHPTEKIELLEQSVEHNLKLKNSHPAHPLTNITPEFEGCLDYILFQDQNGLELVTAYPPPSKQRIAEICGLSDTRLLSLPNYHHPSDHLPLIADFILKPL